MSTEKPARAPRPGQAERLSLPAGYGIETSAEGLLPWSFVVERMAASRNYWVITTRPDGRPHAAPVWGLWLDEAFYFSTDPSSVKGRNIAANPAIVVHLESGDEVVILEGAAEAVTDQALLERFIEAYDAKYDFRMDPSNPAYGVYRVHPRVVLAWREQDFPTSASRWRIPAG